MPLEKKGGYALVPYPSASSVARGSGCLELTPGQDETKPQEGAPCDVHVNIDDTTPIRNVKTFRLHQSCSLPSTRTKTRDKCCNDGSIVMVYAYDVSEVSDCVEASP